jgi:hypothetical protein
MRKQSILIICMILVLFSSAFAAEKITKKQFEEQYGKIILLKAQIAARMGQQPAPSTTTPTQPITPTKPTTTTPTKPTAVACDAKKISSEIAALFKDKDTLKKARDTWKKYNTACGTVAEVKKVLDAWDTQLKRRNA